MRKAFPPVLESIAEPNVNQIVLHMAKVEFVDSAALGMLLLSHEEAQKRQKHISIHGATGR